jgi:hypothetical protein
VQRELDVAALELFRVIGHVGQPSGIIDLGMEHARQGAQRLRQARCFIGGQHSHDRDALVAVTRRQLAASLLRQSLHSC